MPPAAPDSAPLTLTTREPIARALRSDYALAQRRLGNPVWEVPPIFSLPRWCRDQWLQTWPGEQLLHGVQELVLWQRAIEADGASGDVLSKSALAREARRTGRLLVQYCIDPERGPAYTDEQEAFRRWHRQVRRELLERAWLIDAELPGRVTRLVESGTIRAPSEISLCGPQSGLTPAERRLLQALQNAGSRLQPAAGPARQPPITTTRHATDEQQFRALAAAIGELLRSAREHDESPPTVLVVCPDPAQRRTLIESIFMPVLAPWRLLPGDGQRPLPWRFAAAAGLDQQPLVAVALAICGLSEHDNTLDDLSRLLLASVLWTPAQRAQTARADYALRRLGGMRFSLQALLHATPEPLAGPFQALRQVIHTRPRRALPSTWVAHFEQRLAALGWPGERPQPSHAFQAREAWTLGLATFSAMDVQTGPVTHGQALSWLREIIASRPFEARADHEQPVQILSPQDAAGLSADHLFVVDATDDRFPGPVRRYPLLATEALVQAGVPEITAAAALDGARALATELLARSAAVHLSYAEMDEREARRKPTSLFGAALEWQRPEAGAPPTAAERAASESRLYLPEVDAVPPVGDPQAEGVFGGVKIFKAYVEAPFFAFCCFRLGIEPLPEPAAGIPANAQGNIIHAVLEAAWRALRTQQALRRLDHAALGELIDGPLDRALGKHLPAERFGRTLRQIERARLRDVILQWLEHEKRRTEPFEVIERETRADLDFEGLALTLVVDRVDQVETPQGTRHLILDYKTGRDAEVRGWKADRLQEPQLPLYATSATLGGLGIDSVDGIAFAHIKDGHPALAAATNWGMGLIDRKRSFRVESWPEQLQAWREALTAVARGFLAGEAGLDDASRHRFGLNRSLLDLVREDT
jgi:probable DNA repair protein